MKFEHTEVWGFAHALRGMRNPKESWHLNDSFYSRYTNAIGNPAWNVEQFQKTFCRYEGVDAILYNIGPNDMRLAQTLIKGGPEHRKFLRQIFVSVDITAPLYWWKEFDTYKVGTVANSTSTMHKIQSKPITLENFETGDFNSDLLIYEHYTVGDFVEGTIEDLEVLRNKYNELKKEDPELAKGFWKELIRWLPESWLQTRTVTMNYENLYAICSIGQRRFHKLGEWSSTDENMNSFISWARTLPYAQEFIFIDETISSEERNAKALHEIINRMKRDNMDKVDFADFGIAILDSDGNIRSIFDVMTDLADAFDKIEKI